MTILAHGGSASAPWAFTPNPALWLLVVSGVLGYFLALRVLGPRYVPSGSPVATTRQKACFLAGIAALWVANEWPVHQLSEGLLFSVHMVQHMILWLVVPPLLLLGIPTWLWRHLLRPKPLFNVARFATKPVVAFFVSNAVIVLIHWPAIVALQLTSDVAHVGVHLVIIGASILMWWPVIGVLPEFGKLSPPAAMFYLFLQSFLPTGPASFLTFGTTPLYDAYNGVARWGISAITDQQVSGLLMKIGGGLFLWTVIAVMFFKWMGSHDDDGLDPTSEQDFEAELEALGMRVTAPGAHDGSAIPGDTT